MPPIPPVIVAVGVSRSSRATTIGRHVFRDFDRACEKRGARCAEQRILNMMNSHKWKSGQATAVAQVRRRERICAKPRSKNLVMTNSRRARASIPLRAQIDRSAWAVPADSGTLRASGPG
jgi:hypothetical protein